MLLDELKKLGKGIVLPINGRICYIELSELEPLGEELFLKIKSRDVFAILYHEIQTKQGPVIMPQLLRLNEGFHRSAFVILKLSDLKPSEIIDENSKLHKMIVEVRSKLVTPGKKKIKLV